MHVDVKNTGAVGGKEVVQLYVAPKKVKAIRPVRELKGFEKISLEPGETKTVSFSLGERAFAYRNADTHSWEIEDGGFGIEICKNAHEVILRQEI